MSQENVEIVRRLYEEIAPMLKAFGEGEIHSPPSELVDEQIEWRGPREFPDLAEPLYGHEGVRRYMEKLSEAIEGYRMVPEEFIDAGGDQVLVFSREGGRGRGSGAEVQTHPTAHLWTLRDGKAVRMQSYWERADALEAAGLRE
jgi:ketosteroid isomerase-like protein